jgi:hypothetical protein
MERQDACAAEYFDKLCYFLKPFEPDKFDEKAASMVLALP